MTKPFDPTRPVQTRDGRKARIICTDVFKARDPDHKILALIAGSIDGNEVAAVYTTSGRFLGDDAQSPADLVNVPDTVHQYYNIYSGRALSAHYNNEELCRVNRRSGYTGILKLTFEDGVPVSAEVLPA